MDWVATHLICGYCRSRGEGYRVCGSCKLVFYCCRDCQVADWEAHKTSCSTIREYRKGDGFSADDPKAKMVRYFRRKKWKKVLKCGEKLLEAASAPRELIVTLGPMAAAHLYSGDARASAERGLQLLEMHKTNPTWFKAGQAPLIVNNLIQALRLGGLDKKIHCQALAAARRVAAHEPTVDAFLAMSMAYTCRVKQDIELSPIQKLEHLAALRAAHLLKPDQLQEAHFTQYVNYIAACIELAYEDKRFCQLESTSDNIDAWWREHGFMVREAIAVIPEYIRSMPATASKGRPLALYRKMRIQYWFSVYEAFRLKGNDWQTLQMNQLLHAMDPDEGMMSLIADPCQLKTEICELLEISSLDDIPAELRHDGIDATNAWRKLSHLPPIPADVWSKDDNASEAPFSNPAAAVAAAIKASRAAAKEEARAAALASASKGGGISAKTCDAHEAKLEAWVVRKLRKWDERKAGAGAGSATAAAATGAREAYEAKLRRRVAEEMKKVRAKVRKSGGGAQLKEE